MRVILDTSILRKDPGRKRASFRALERLARQEKIALFLPHVVEREFVTQEAELIKKPLIEAKSSLRSALRRPVSPTRLKQFQEILSGIETALQEAELAAEAIGADLVRALNATRIPVGSGHGESVLNAYFSGAPPFKELKSRDDIPDAFLYETLRDLISNGPLEFVSADRNLRDAAAQIHNVRVHESLEALLGTPQATALLLQAVTLEHVETVKRTLPMVNAGLAQHISDRVGPAIEGESLGDWSIPEDNHEATVFYWYGVDSAELYPEGAEFLGDGDFIVPFSARLIVGLSYAIFKSDYYALPDDQASAMSISDLNDHYFDVEEERTVEVRGMLTFEVPEGLLVDPNSESDAIADSVVEAEFYVDSVSSIELAEQGG